MDKTTFIHHLKIKIMSWFCKKKETPIYEYTPRNRRIISKIVAEDNQSKFQHTYVNQNQYGLQAYARENRIMIYQQTYRYEEDNEVIAILTNHSIIQITYTETIF